MNGLDQLVRDTLHERVGEAPAAAPVVARVLAEPRRRSRRSWVSGAAAAACLVLGTVGVVALGSDEPDEVPVGQDPASPPTLVDRCLTLGAETLDPDRWTDASVVTSAEAGPSSRAVLLSADRTQWADCEIDDSRGDVDWQVQVYPIAPPRPGSTEYEYSAGPGSFSLAERFPADVAEVRLRFASGEVRSAAAVDGFVVLVLRGDGLGELDALLQYDASGRLVGAPSLAKGDADLPAAQRSLVPPEPLAAASGGDDD